MTGFSCDAVWTTTFGNHVNTAIAVSDGGYAGVGYTGSLTNANAWFVRLDDSGNVLWDRKFSAGIQGSANSVVEDSGNFVVVGAKRSDSHGVDGWFLMLDSGGNARSSITYGSSSDDFLQSVDKTPDGKYIVTGYFGAPYSQLQGASVLKLDSSGAMEWGRSYGEKSFFTKIKSTRDGGYIVVGVFKEGKDINQGWIVKLDSSGNVVWDKKYGGQDLCALSDVIETGDGGFVAVGVKRRKRFNESGRLYSFDSQRLSVLKFGADGVLQWEREHEGVGSNANPGSIKNSITAAVHETSDGQFVVAGYIKDASAASGDAWLLKLDRNGDILRQQRCGSGGEDSVSSLVSTNDGQVAAVGRSDNPAQSWMFKLGQDWGTADLPTPPSEVKIPAIRERPNVAEDVPTERLDCGGNYYPQDGKCCVQGEMGGTMCVVDSFTSPIPRPNDLEWYTSSLLISDGSSTVRQVLEDGHELKLFTAPFEVGGLAFAGRYLGATHSPDTISTNFRLFNVNNQSVRAMPVEVSGTAPFSRVTESRREFDHMRRFAQFRRNVGVLESLTYDGRYFWATATNPGPISGSIVKFGRDGKIVDFLQYRGRYPRLSGITWDGQQYFWISEYSYESMRGRICQITKEGKMRNCFEAPAKGRQHPSGLAWHASSLWSADSESGKIYRLQIRE